MISDIQKAIAVECAYLYPSCTVYKDYDPQNFKTPSFLITIADHTYGKRTGTINNSLVSFDLQYFSGVPTTNIAGIRADCHAVQENLFRAFDIVGIFRILNKSARITDEVLHFTFDIKYSEIKTVTETAMQTMTEKTGLKE
jgi:hypothetical protein